MKKILLLISIVVSLSFKYDSANKSVVVKKLDSCDYFILYNIRGYVVAEHYSGHEFDEGDYVYGNINGYGFKNLYNSDLDDDDKERVYIEDYGMSKDDAIEMLLDKCD